MEGSIHLKLLTSPDRIFEVSDKELVLLAVVYEANEHTRNLARAEQVRRQTIAIQRFSMTSTWLSAAMIVLAGVTGWTGISTLLHKLLGP